MGYKEPLNSFKDKHDYSEEKKAEEERKTDETISDKNPKSRNENK